MHLRIGFLLIFCLLYFAYGQSLPACAGQRIIRSEIRSLSESERTKFFSVVTKAHKIGWFDWFSFVHNTYAGTIHGCSIFLPWHRKFIREFEHMLRNYDPDLALPYYDAAIDGDDPASSVFFKPEYIGGDGVGENRCVMDGPLAGANVGVPNERCLQRMFDGGPGHLNPWQTPESVTSDIQIAVDFSDFANRIETGLHAYVHVGIGGDLFTNYSPNDIAFFLHHSNLDRIWWKWQNTNAKNLQDYGGKNIDETPAKITDKMDFYGTLVSDVLLLGYGDMCYGYTDLQELNPGVGKRDGSKGSGRPAPLASVDKKKSAKFRSINLEKQGLSTNPGDVETVLKVPDMSLVQALSDETLNKFFPKLASGEAQEQLIEMPTAVGNRSLTFAKAADSKNSQKSSFRSLAPPLSEIGVDKADPDAVKSAFALSLKKKASKKFSKRGFPSSGGRVVKRGNVMPIMEERDSRYHPRFDNLVSIRQDANKPKMAPPKRLPPEYLKMMFVDPVFAEKYYQEKLELYNALNKEGYVSPYL
ncbi:hypothetical protein BB560_003105 [Smittium megazygosporum]|uniref:Tyrosinase copper-binding domain-containing protein n=1 Tax=Smittium megazygosporum TaxID=133381 RepID=A0A2T9ZCW7_9FUNG|nr:hypothetical protein BB560_003105 [Smittium megazygosporum]